MLVDTEHLTHGLVPAAAVAVLPTLATVQGIPAPLPSMVYAMPMD
jgi:hypothetical protein